MLKCFSVSLIIAVPSTDDPWGWYTVAYKGSII
jgi:hypothetical protein